MYNRNAINNIYRRKLGPTENGCNEEEIRYLCRVMASQIQGFEEAQEWE